MLPYLEKCPRNVLVCEKSRFGDEKSRHGVHVSKHYFNYKVCILIPECAALPHTLQTLVSGFSKYFLVKSLPVYELLERVLLEKFANAGHLYGLSYNTRIDQDNTFAFLPTGQLILSVDKDTYEQLGLEGKRSQYTHKQPMRYVVTVDLTDKSMAPGTKRYARVMWALKEKIVLKSDFLLAVDSTAGSDAVPVLISCLGQYQWKELSVTLSTETLRNLPCPTLHPDDLEGKRSCEPHEFLEWLGAVSMGISCDNKASDFLSSYACPQPQSTISQALLCTITGLVLPSDVLSLLEELRLYLEQPKCPPWTSLVVHGFADSPVSWATVEHGFHKGGENFYSFVLFGKQDYWLHMGTGASDCCPP